MRDLLTTAVEQVCGTAGCFFPGQPFVQFVSTLHDLCLQQSHVVSCGFAHHRLRNNYM